MLNFVETLVVHAIIKAYLILAIENLNHNLAVKISYLRSLSVELKCDRGCENNINSMQVYEQAMAGRALW